MHGGERKNKENLGQEIFFGNLLRRLKNISRLGYIFTILFVIFFTFFVIHNLDLKLFLRQVEIGFEFLKTHFNFLSWSSSRLKPSQFELIMSPNIFVFALLKSFVASSLLTFSCHLFFMKVGRKFATQEVLDGANELDMKSLNHQIFSWLKKWRRIEEQELGIKKFDFFEWNDLGACSKEERRKIFYGAFLSFGDKAKVYIPEEFLKTHIGVEGATGTGKSVLINSVCHQIQRHKNTQACVLDYNGQYYSIFGRPGDIVLSINHKGGVKWNPWSEKIQPEKMAASLIEDDPNDKFFAPAARGLLCDLLSLNNNIEDFWKDLTKPKEEIYEKLFKYGLTSAEDFASKSGAQGAGVRRTMTLKLDALRSLNYWTKNNEEISIIDWAKNGSDRWIFIIVREEDREKAKPWVRLWMDLVVSGILMRNHKNKNNTTWLIGDEIHLLGKMPSLEDGITNGRKYNFRCLLGYQTEGQIDEVYDKSSKGIKNSVRTRVIFNPGDPESAQKCAMTLGKKEIYDPIESESFGETKNKNSMSSNNQIREKFVVHPETLRLLDKTECYIRLPMFNPVRMRIPLKSYPEINKPVDCENPPRILQISNQEG